MRCQSFLQRRLSAENVEESALVASVLPLGVLSFAFHGPSLHSPSVHFHDVGDSSARILGISCDLVVSLLLDLRNVGIALDRPVEVVDDRLVVVVDVRDLFVLRAVEVENGVALGVPSQAAHFAGNARQLSQRLSL